MSLIASVLCTLAGAALVLLVLRDAFEALFHPDGRTVLSRAIMRGSWRLFHRLCARRPGSLPLAGPFTLVTIVSSWAVLLAVGWALILWPHFPDGFRFATELGPPENQRSFIDALYMSLVTLATIGYGDISPSSDVLRLLVPIEALVGFGLLTAAVSWLLSVYPALSRRRSLAYEITLLREVAEGAPNGDFVRRQADSAERIFADLLSRLVAVERDLVTIPLSYYFTERDDRFSLAAVMPWLLALADEGLTDDVSAPTRLRARMLRAAIDDFARSTAKRFHGGDSGTTAELLEQYARDHLCEPASTRRVGERLLPDDAADADARRTGRTRSTGTPAQQ